MTSEKDIGTGRLTLYEIKAIIKMGLVQGNLIPTFAGAWLAIVFGGFNFFQSLPIVLLMIVGSTLIMGGACAINNYYDQDIDSIMPSKQKRPTVNGRISDRHLIQLSFGLMILGETLLFMINIPTGIIGLLGIFGYVVLYSIWSKRHTVWNTVVGSFPGAIPPLIGWASIDPSLSPLAWTLFLVLFAWQPAHFYALAYRRKDEYALANIPMLPSVKSFNRTRLSMLLWVVLLLPLPFLMTQLGTVFIVIATLLNIAWMILALNGFKKEINKSKWATSMFVFSLNYLVIFFVMTVLVTVVQLI
ncbi:heme o synthase [Mammaliicoccus fleurettii]|uniref:Protoheme IX farnesyltransferase n=1 Tax=Mammaliicoccus fleurettii TaxID=150056 RepID=A0ABS5MKF0_9STAP|nr:heme o synthase [Mammaliicoccus fleurettii]MBL0846607.1 protoheme IX farnesyltransferase [Mammaliicoccus fleurettii]MBS3671048.1 heme o synthase [Mammaliicoccus fleurettii]MBS3696107.1 heme o synthase [Mammaliicoccus fleurettii]MBW0764401.1 protoheme IX farnesyltransferase [Mammaliicoccus fleurettii]MEB7805361.1 heme o synthase [Mammaliicoccus fleurettii]